MIRSNKTVTWTADKFDGGIDLDITRQYVKGKCQGNAFKMDCGCVDVDLSLYQLKRMRRLIERVLRDSQRGATSLD